MQLRSNSLLLCHHRSLLKGVLTHCSEQLHTRNKNNNSAPCPALLFICDYTAFTFGVRGLHLNHFGQCCHNNQLKWDCLPWEKQPHKTKSERSRRAEMSTVGPLRRNGAVITRHVLQLTWNTYFITIKGTP